MLLAFLVLFRTLLRVAWLATTVWVVVAGALIWAQFGGQLAALPIAFVLSGVMALVIHRFGLLAYVVTSFWFFVLAGVPITTDFSVWYSTATLVSLGALLAFVLLSFGLATRGQFGDTAAG